MRKLCFTIIVAMLSVNGILQADIYGLQKGSVELKSAGPLAFGPSGILFVSDPMGAQVVAIQTGDTEGDAANTSYNFNDITGEIAKSIEAQKVEIADLASNPETGHLFLSIIADGTPALVKITGDTISKVAMTDIAFSNKELADAPENKVTGEGRRQGNKRSESVTDLAFVDGELIVSGLNNEGKSTVRSLVFPFSKVDKGSPLEIYHAAHGKSEDSSAMRTFIPMVIDGQANLLAGFVCTPLVKFPISDIGKGEQIKGTTVAELGNRNRPLDMIVYEQGGSNFLLMANSARGVMKISTSDIENNTGLTEPVQGGGAAGQPYETINALEGTVQLDKLSNTHAVVVIDKNGQQSLKSVELP